MARDDRGDKQRKRALEAIERGIARNDLAMALEGLLSVPVEDRGGFIPALRPRFAVEVASCHARLAWGLLGQLAVRADREPRLAGDDTDEHAHAVWWALLWGCLQTKDFDRAARAWARIAASVRARAPGLAAAVESWVTSRSGPAPELLRGLDLPEMPAVDPRLGIEPVRARAVVPPPPRDVNAVEAAVLRAYATLPWGTFESTVRAWTSGPVSELSNRIWSLAAALSERELRVRATRPRARTGEPIALLVEAARSVSDPATVREQVAIAFRMAVRATTGGAQSELAKDAIARLLPAALRDPALRSVAIDTVTGLPRAALKKEVAISLYLAALEAAPSVALWIRLAEWIDTPDVFSGRVVDTLSVAFGSLKTQHAEWGAHLRGLEPRVRQKTFAALDACEEPSRWIDWVDHVWNELDELGRADLSTLLNTALDASLGLGRGSDEFYDGFCMAIEVLRGAGIPRSRMRAELERDWRQEFPDGMPLEIRRALDAALDGKPPSSSGRPDDAKARAIWQRFEARALLLGGGFLGRAFQFARTVPEAQAVARSAQARARRIEDWLDIIERADAAEFHDVGHDALADAIERMPGDVHGWARAYDWAEISGLPCMVVPIATAFTSAASANPTRVTPAMQRALVSASMHLRPKRKTKPRKQSTKPPKKVRQPVGPGIQPSLALDGLQPVPAGRETPSPAGPRKKGARS